MKEQEQEQDFKDVEARAAIARAYKIDNFFGKSKLNFWAKNEDFKQCEYFTSVQSSLQ